MNLTNIRIRNVGALILSALLLAVATAEAFGRFERTYTPQGKAHLTISNTNGNVIVTAWQKKTISVRAVTAANTEVVDEKRGEDIQIATKKSVPLGRADFEVFLPADTSLSVNNVIGKIEVNGLSGHLSIKSFNSDVHIRQARCDAINVMVTSGNIVFDGILQTEGDYSFQSLKGDIDMSLPDSASFNLTARALHSQINLGEFINSFSNLNRGSKQISGTHKQGGAKLTLTTYAGRILLHKK